MDLDETCIHSSPGQHRSAPRQPQRPGALSAQLQLLYQPIADLQHGGVIAVEVVGARQDPESSPATAERDGACAGQAGPIDTLGYRMLRHACQDLLAWRDAGLPAVRLAINLSTEQLGDSGLPHVIGAVLSEFGIAPAQLVLEIAETVLVEDAPNSAPALANLRALGVGLALDEFGTGSSSLSHLERFPLGRVKIHRDLTRNVASNPDDAALVKTIIAMAHHLGMQVAADGVDAETQCDFLRRNMCDHIQGVLFAAPVGAAGIATMLAAQHTLPAHLLRFIRSRKRTLLLVDDEPNIVSALKRLLRPDGYQILSAYSGQEGLEVLSQNEVDVIVSDQRMPGMLGADFLRAAKSRYPHTIRIMLSGYTELQSVTAAVNEGAIYKFLTKPWEDDQLRAHIADAFRLKEIADENARLNLELRTANHELAKANRKMAELLRQKQQQITLDATSLNVARELLQFLPLAIIGLDDDGNVAFVNAAADTLFLSHGAILGNEAAIVLPELFPGGALGNGKHTATIDGRPFEVLVHPMGNNSTSRGSLITISGCGERA
jgi:EAL domain-containing protein (putative c-di-GMP-specific phosphodiesterase class I)/CheY-like chemotaxis protein